MTSFTKILLTAAACALAVSCQNGANQPSGDTEVPSIVLGAWNGMYKSKNKDINLIETATAKAIFDKKGNFNIEVENSANMKASGTYEEFFEGESIFLHVAKSTIPRLGKDGSTTIDLNYSTKGDALLLSNEATELKLKRSDEGSDEDDFTEEELTERPYLGSWVCEDPSNNKWALAFERNDSFWAKIHKSGQRPLWVSGSVSFLGLSNDAEADRRLQIESSSEARLEGSFIKLSVGDRETITITTMDRATNPPSPIETFDCTRA
jgi:hypothetical protein